jgi:hypothetical protein
VGCIAVFRENGAPPGIRRRCARDGEKGIKKKSAKKAEAHCQREKTCVSIDESEMLSDQNDEMLREQEDKNND